MGVGLLRQKSMWVGIHLWKGTDRCCTSVSLLMKDRYAVWSIRKSVVRYYVIVGRGQRDFSVCEDLSTP